MNKNSQSRGWILTEFDIVDPEVLVEKLRMKKWAGVFQLEAGTETGRKHYQMYIEHSSAIRFSTIKKLFPTAHVEPRKGTKKQAWDYCSKEETRLSGPWEIAPVAFEEQGKRSDLEDYRDFLVEGGTIGDLFEQFPNAMRYVAGLNRLEEELAVKAGKNVIVDRTVDFIYGPTGSGKTLSIFEKYERLEFYRVTNWKNPFDNYRGERVIVLDEFLGQLPIETMLMLMDRYSSVFPARYRDRVNLSEKIIIISNLSLSGIKQRYVSNGVADVSWAAFERRIANVFYKDCLESDFVKMN